MTETITTAHEFNSETGSKGKCIICGMTRGAKAHRAEPETEVIKVRTWVGWRVADTAIARGGSLGAKLAATKPDSVRDRHVGLTADEAEELSAIATEMETAALGTKGAGPVVYSCRTLRARLA